MLADFYNAVKESRKDSFEIVFVSSDQNKGQFEEYFATMPWLALDFEEKEIKVEYVI